MVTLPSSLGVMATQWLDHDSELLQTDIFHQLNTLRPRQNGRHFADDVFKLIFLNENV